jgi:ssDNA-binding Zn-finger/Zn-ribbon topoisomerase 1
MNLLKPSLKIKCPSCGADAFYSYGKTHNGKKRFLCLMCNRQFTLQAKRREIKNRPLCPKCGTPMHCYMRHKDFTRFRCGRYPDCKTYLKLPLIKS